MAANPPAAAVRNPYSPRPNWVYPTLVVVVFSAFALYAAWAVLFFKEGRYGPYLSPFNSPEIHVWIGSFLIPTGIWIAGIPLAFRLTCYYYRKAIFRGYFGHPRSCATPEPLRRRYFGETRFFVYNNLHRFAFYLTAIQVVILWLDFGLAFWYQGGFHLGVGNLLMAVNVVCLSAYTFGCHAFRHLAGGGRDCLSCSQARLKLWRGVTVLNIKHEQWAWVSMFTVWAVDLYIRLLLAGVVPHVAWA